MRILIIDDDPNYGQAMTSFLIGQDHEVQRIMDPKIALKSTKDGTNQFDVILLDLIMPSMSGLDLLGKLRDAGNPLPVVLVSGFADLENSAEAVHLGISGLVVKPFIPGQLIRILNKVERELGFISQSLAVQTENKAEEKELSLRDGWQTQIIQLMNTSIDCWRSLSGGGRANLAEVSGIWKVNVDGESLRTRTLDRYLKLETLPTRPKLGKVLDTAKFVLERSPPSSLRYTLDTKVRVLELTLDALGLWNPKPRINKFENKLIAKIPATKKEI
ncbi:MAG: response regulator [Deltaproteobacteria bacterium]|jgi:CheY-like chemotaxis protein|nr:response regulator [Deltaproteobacteria bacterium]